MAAKPAAAIDPETMLPAPVNGTIGDDEGCVKTLIQPLASHHTTMES